MGALLTNSQAYNIKAENELAIILSNFDTEYIMSIMDENIDRVFDSFEPLPRPNIVNAFEANYKAILANWPEDKLTVVADRDQTYRDIVAKMAARFDFEFRATDEIDIFSSASFLYDFFVANFDKYLISFLSDYIIKEQDQLYKSLGMDEFRKDKDIATLYSKKVFSNLTIAILCSHMDRVLGYISGFDFSLEYILNSIYNNNISILSIFQNVSMRYDFYKDVYMRVLHTPALSPVVITHLKMEIQRRTAPPDSTINLNF